MDAAYAFVAEISGEGRVKTIAYRTPTGISPNIEFELAGTPCEDVVNGTLCHHPDGVASRFPRDATLAQKGVQSYLGVPLNDKDGVCMGHLAVFDTKPMPPEPRKLMIFRIFAARASAEVMRVRMEKELEQSAQRFRDLFEQAPIAYVHEDLQSRFISANRAAMNILGIKPDEVKGMVGMSLVADTPENQRVLHEAFASISKGTDTGGIVLELHRKDNGKPIWIQWWSRPDVSGMYTRTMFIDITERVLMERERTRLQAQNLYLQEEIKSVHNFEEIIGESPAVLAVLDNVRRVAQTDASVLITGETGTGKELIARAIHSASNRADRPLVKVNCAALPTGLVESELFGHEKGAFSGAIQRRVGRFELAHGGTIFLDEVGEIPMDVQVKLLRVLQEREFERVGNSSPIKVDVRVIAATNRDLRRMIAEGEFREDLYYRLNVFPIAMPSLRERGDDVQLLTRFLLNRCAARVGRRIKVVGHETMERIRTYRWPGNVRELENVRERAVILCTGETLEIDPEVFASGTQATPGSDGGRARSAPGVSSLLDLEAVERNHIEAVLTETGWRIEGEKGAARILNLHPNTLRSRMKKLGISREQRSS